MKNDLIVVGAGYVDDLKVAVVSLVNVADNRETVVLTKEQAQQVISRLIDVFDLDVPVNC